MTDIWQKGENVNLLLN